MNNVYPTKPREGVYGIKNQAFESSVHERQEPTRPHGDIVKLQPLANSVGTYWRNYVTKRKRKRHRSDSSFVSDHLKQRTSMVEQSRGLEVDKDAWHKETELWLQRDLHRHHNDLKLERKLIEYFVMLNTQPSETSEVDLDFIYRLLKKGVNINCIDQYGQTVLHEVARLWHTDVAKFLIKNGADVNKRDRYGRSPLHVAAAADYPDMIEFLLKKKAKLRARTIEEEQTPLHLAARYDAVEACKVLVKHGADIEAKDYRKRTPVYVAAEFGRSETARWLMENGADVGICDDTGQSCMTHMITNMGPVAKAALDKFCTTDQRNRKQCFHLNLLERDISDIKGSFAKTLLQVIVGCNQLDIIMHPVILKLLDEKWKEFGRTDAFKSLAWEFGHTFIWTILAIFVPWQTRYQYLLPGSIAWRAIFWILAMSLTIRFLLIEMREYVRSKRQFKSWKKWREDSIKKDEKFCHEKCPEELNYLNKQIENMIDMVPPYFKDFWNIFDWAVYFLNFCVFFTHFANVSVYNSDNRPPACCTPAGCDTTTRLIQNGVYNERTACAVIGASVNNGCLSVWVNRVFAINIIMMWLRLMKNIKPFRTLGPFVVMLGKITYDVLRFVFLYFQFYIPYACAFWMIFGVESDIDSMSTVDELLFTLYRITLVDEYEYNQMHTFDVVMTYFLVGSFLGISALLFINLFIALLSDTFHRVYDNAMANAAMQQAIFIVGVEESMSKQRRRQFLRFIKEKCSPIEEDYDDGGLRCIKGDNLENATIQVHHQIEQVLDYIRTEKQEKENLKGNESTMKQMQRDLREIKRLLMPTTPSNKGRMSRKQRRYGTAEQVMRESPAASLDRKSKVVHSSQEQEPLSPRSHASEVELVILPGTTTPASVTSQSSNFPAESGLPSTEFSTIEMPDA